MRIASLFSGAGGMDLGFKRAGFKTVWANENDKTIYPSFKNHFKGTTLDTRSISEITSTGIPKDIVGVIGGPPCQSWSAAGAKRGIDDHRGKLFYEYLRIIKIISPKFFVAENVAGILHKRNLHSFESILNELELSGYIVRYKLLNAHDYEVPQDRKRVIIVGYHKSLDKEFLFPKPIEKKKTLRDSIGDIQDLSSPISNHEYMDSGYSPIFLSRNRIRKWSEPSFTILATDRHIPFHPSCPPMLKIGKDKMTLSQNGYYRRLTVRECARIQTFPDNYKFLYTNIRTGYKMVGNAVPVNLAYHIAKVIKKDLDNVSS
jgi:DNA (cytosine-5)-methyltransferase 1